MVAEVRLLPALTVLWLRERGSQGSSKSLHGLWEGELPPLPGSFSCSECWSEAIRLSFNTCPFDWTLFLGILRRESVREGGRGGFFAFFREMFRERFLSWQFDRSPWFFRALPSKILTTLCLGFPKPSLLLQTFPGPCPELVRREV